MRFIPPKQCGCGCGFGKLFSSLLIIVGLAGTRGWCQRPPLNRDADSLRTNAVAQRELTGHSEFHSTNQDTIAQWQGLPVRSIAFEGVTKERLSPLEGKLAQGVGVPLDQEKVAASLRQVFATGLFDSVEVVGGREGDGVAILFRGVPRMFIGMVSVDGAKGATVNTQLQRASRLNSGTRFTKAKISQALEQMKFALAENGYHEETITYKLQEHHDEQLVDIAFHVVSGPQARVGAVSVTGDPGMSLESFRHHAHLKTGQKVDHETINRALNGMLKEYRDQKRLEAEIKLESQSYAANKMNYTFTANKGPIVRVLVAGRAARTGTSQAPDSDFRGRHGGR